MKITELKDWGTLTAEEQARLREAYQVGEDDELPESFTHETPEQEVPTAPQADTNVTINAENVEVNESEK
jgi:hypothetical protein